MSLAIKGLAYWEWHELFANEDWRNQWIEWHKKARLSGYRCVTVCVWCEGGGFYWGIFAADPFGAGIYHWSGESWEFLGSPNRCTKRARDFVRVLSKFLGSKVKLLGEHLVPHRTSRNWPAETVKTHFITKVKDGRRSGSHDGTAQTRRSSRVAKARKERADDCKRFGENSDTNRPREI